MRVFLTKFVACIVLIILLLNIFPTKDIFAQTPTTTPKVTLGDAGDAALDIIPLFRLTKWLSQKAGASSVTGIAESGGSFVADLIGGASKVVSSIAKATFEFVMIPIVSYFVVLSGKMLNYSIEYTIFTPFGGGSGNPIATFDEPIKAIWTIVRDLFNLTFIFILLYIAITKIIGSAGSKAKEMLLSVVISAIFINFSFFVTRVVIDTSNMVATTIYNQIEIDVGGKKINSDPVLDGILKGITGKESNVKLSESLRDAVGLTTIYKSTAVLKNFGSTTLGGSFLRFILFFVTGFVFSAISLLLIGRFVMLIFLIASSPIGFLFGSIPGTKSYSAKWKDELIKQTIVAPVFMFFMLMIVKISNTDTLKKASTNNTDIGLYFNYILIISLLVISLKITKKLSGQVAGFADKAGALVSGAALTVATGGVAFAGRQVIGRLAAKGANGDLGKNLQERAAKGGLSGGFGLANLALKGIKGTSKASFDLRSSKIAQGTMSQIKTLSGGAVDIQGAMGSLGNLGKAGGEYGKDKKGFVGWKEKQKENITKKSQEYDTAAKDAEAKAEFDAQNENNVGGKREEAKVAKEKLDRLKNNLATSGTIKTSNLGDEIIKLGNEEKIVKDKLTEINNKLSLSTDPIKRAELTKEQTKVATEHKEITTNKLKLETLKLDLGKSGEKTPDTLNLEVAKKKLEENLAKKKIDDIETKINNTKDTALMIKLTAEKTAAQKEYENKKANTEKAVKKVADVQRLTTDTETAQKDYDNKEKIKRDAEKNTKAGLSNMAEDEFQKIPTGDSRRKAYDDAEAKIKEIRSRQSSNTNDLDSGAKTKAEYDREEATLQNEIKDAIAESDKAKEAGIKAQMNVVEDMLLKNDKPEDAVLIGLIKRKRMRGDFANQLKTKLSLLTENERNEMIKIVNSPKGDATTKTEMEKSLAELLKGMDEIKNKK
ncbi:MAG: hypothetical protein WC827_02830 [Candidatus Paceibacterota bacterium]|jgi:hypothetical protein